MHEPSPRSSRLAIAGGLAAAIVLGGIGFFVGRSTSPSPPPVVIPQPAPKEQPVGTPVMDRGALLQLVNIASDAAASGTPPPTEVSKAAGRRFELVLPFGCDGPADRERTAGLGWHYDSENATLRIRVFPTRWLPADWRLATADKRAVGLEGFWVERPWSSASRCPATAARSGQMDSEPILLPGQTLAIAHLVDDGDDDDPRPLETVQRIGANEFDPTQGFRLRVLGRLAPALGSPPVKCIQPMGSAQRPLCLIWMKLTEIRIENPANGAVLATWPYANETPGIS